MTEKASRIVSAIQPNFAVYLKADFKAGVFEECESVGVRPMDEYATSLTDEQYRCIAKHIVAAMRSE